MSDPYTQINITDSTFERIFDLSVDSEELVWHRDKKTRFVKVLEGVGWQFQFDNDTQAFHLRCRTSLFRLSYFALCT